MSCLVAALSLPCRCLGAALTLLGELVVAGLEVSWGSADPPGVERVGPSEESPPAALGAPIGADPADFPIFDRFRFYL